MEPRQYERWMGADGAIGSYQRSLAARPRRRVESCAATVQPLRADSVGATEARLKEGGRRRRVGELEVACGDQCSPQPRGRTRLFNCNDRFGTHLDLEGREVR